jgi:hypothetical protein
MAMEAGMRYLRYDWLGAALGAVLPVAATVLTAWQRHGGVGLRSLVAAQAAEPLLWLIDTAPFVVAAFGWAVERQRKVVAAQQARIARVESQRRTSLEHAAADLSASALNLLGDVSSLGAASAQMTASVRGTIATMTALSQGATAVALAAETAAGRASEAAADPDATREQLLATLRSTGTGAKEIARIAQEQMDGIERVLAAMNQIHFATESSAEAAQEIADEARALAKRARELRISSGARPTARELAFEAAAASVVVASVAASAHASNEADRPSAADIDSALDAAL